jgi:hypothetical protein
VHIPKRNQPTLPKQQNSSRQIEGAPQRHSLIGGCPQKVSLCSFICQIQRIFGLQALHILAQCKTKWRIGVDDAAIKQTPCKGNIDYFNTLRWAFSPKSCSVYSTQGCTLGWNMQAFQAVLSICPDFPNQEYSFYTRSFSSHENWNHSPHLRTLLVL